MLESIQLFFFRLILRVPPGSPKIALRSETGLLSMRLRIWKAKCMLVHHLKGLKTRPGRGGVTDMCRSGHRGCQYHFDVKDES